MVKAEGVTGGDETRSISPDYYLWVGRATVYIMCMGIVLTGCSIEVLACSTGLGSLYSNINGMGGHLSTA